MNEWAPLCMSPDELAAWTEANERLVSMMRARSDATPCTDCPLWFAQAMRAVGMCNGQPLTGGRPRKDEPASEERRAQWRAAKQRQKREHLAAYMREYRRKQGGAARASVGT